MKIDTQLIAPSRSFGYTPMYLDFLNGARAVHELYRGSDLADVVNRLDHHPYNREALTSILHRQNTSFGTGVSGMANLERLRSRDAVVVVSGQQAVLFGGPMLILLKAIALAKYAKHLETELNRPVIPLFWIAGDDHDFAEVNHTYLVNRSGDLSEVRYDAVPLHADAVANVRFSSDSALEAARSSYASALGESEFTSEINDLVASCYQPNSTVTDAFGKLMAALTKKWGVVFFCPADQELKKLAVPFFQTMIERQTEVHHLESMVSREIVARGYHIQVEKSDHSSFLFYHDTERTPLHRNGQGFLIREEKVSTQDLLGRLVASPERFSPDVLTRPILQSWLFPVACQFGGPSEIAYLAQSNPLFTLFNLAPPVYRARPSATYVEHRLSTFMTQHGITFNELSGDIEQVVNRVLAATFPAGLAQSWESSRTDLINRFGESTRASIAFDPSLAELAKQTSGKIDFLLKQFEEKMFSSHKKKSKELRERIYRLQHLLFPERSLQERTLNVGYFLARYGFSFLDSMYDSIDVTESRHHIVTIAAGEK